MIDKLYYTLNGKKYGPLRYPHIAKRFKNKEIPMGTIITRNAIFDQSKPIAVELYVIAHEEEFKKETKKLMIFGLIAVVGFGIFALVQVKSLESNSSSEPYVSKNEKERIDAINYAFMKGQADAKSGNAMSLNKMKNIGWGEREAKAYLSGLESEK